MQYKQMRFYGTAVNNGLQCIFRNVTCWLDVLCIKREMLFAPPGVVLAALRAVFVTSGVVFAIPRAVFAASRVVFAMSRYVFVTSRVVFAVS